MKKLALLVLFASFTLIGYSQDKSTRKSPPAKATATIDGNMVTIDYSQPAVNGREIFGALVPYGKVWRAGANETTTFEFAKDAKVNGMDVPAGKYGFYIIPNEKTWTLILNKKIGWGSSGYSKSDDVLRFDARVMTSKESTERLEYLVVENGRVNIKWANSSVSFTIE